LTLKGDWSSRDRAAVRAAVRAVAGQFSAILGVGSAMAFSVVFNPITMEMGNCDKCDPGSDVAGYTYGANEIRFAGLSDISHERRVNHVVHELGHAFKWALYNRTGNDLYSKLSDWRTNHPGYPDRETFEGPEGTTGPNYGFASGQNEFTWQQSLSGEDNEEFADQFLGWTFGKWETNRFGFLTSYGQARSSMMSVNMPLWVNLAAGK
jgi:hypothetical protein